MDQDLTAFLIGILAFSLYLFVSAKTEMFTKSPFRKK